MRRFVVLCVVVACMFLGTFGVAPPAASVVTEKLTLVHSGISSPIGEQLVFGGTLHLTIVENAHGTTLHVNLSQGEAVGQTTGNRYGGTGAEKIPVPTGPGDIAVSPTFEFNRRGLAADLAGRVDLTLMFNLVLTYDRTGAIESVRLVSITQTR